MTATIAPLVPREAVAALLRRGARLDPSFDWREVWSDEHATTFTVAKSAGFDILRDILDAVAEGLGEGKTLRDFQARLEPVLRDKGWWGKQEVVDPATGETVEARLGSPRRLKTIFETNVRVSYAQGAWARFERDKAQRPWLRYVALLDGRARPAHLARHNVCLPVDDPWWDRWAPPCGWGCRCALQSLSDRDVARLQREGERLVFAAPPDREVEWLNTRTGEIERVTAGIDPGWDYNPGKAALSAARAIARVLDAPEGWTTAALQAMPRAAREEAYRRWALTLLQGGRPSIGHMPVGRMSEEVARAAGVEGDERWIVMPQSLIGHAMRALKQERGRAPSPEEIMRAADAIDAPLETFRDRATGELHYLVRRSATQWTRIVVRPGWRIATARSQGRGRSLRGVIVTMDRVPIQTYPNPGTFDRITSG